ncbi:MAG: class I SAM-dependent DNA methyltransferase [Chloroflexota bacterium]
MRGYDPMLSFGAETAADYDRFLRGDEEETVRFLVKQSRGGRTLELAIGTGRIAIPLALAGVPVEGLDLSPEMLAVLRSKTTDNQIPVTLGNFRDIPVEGSFRLIYLVYNTFFNLLTQGDQVTCLANVAKHLDDDGTFLVEAFTPGYLFRLRDNQYVDAEAIVVGEVRLDVARHDPVTQLLEESHVVLSSAGVSVSPIVCRYVWPSELDLMARMAGLRLLDRWGGWNEEPFNPESRRHVSVYGR